MDMQMAPKAYAGNCVSTDPLDEWPGRDSDMHMFQLCYAAGGTPGAQIPTFLYVATRVGQDLREAVSFTVTTAKSTDHLERGFTLKENPNAQAR